MDGIVLFYRTIMFAILVAFLTVFCGCSDPSPDTSNAKKFAKHGIKFDYPGNWVIEDSSADESTREVNVASQGLFGAEGDGSMMINVFDDETELSAFIDIVSGGLQGAVDELTSVGDTPLVETTVEKTRTFKSSVAGKPAQGVVLPYHLVVFGEKVEMVMEFHELKTENGHVIIAGLAPTEDLKTIRPGFQLVYDTMAVTAPRNAQSAR